jgi:hypothetical protein
MSTPHLAAAPSPRISAGGSAFLAPSSGGVAIRCTGTCVPSSARSPRRLPVKGGWYDRGSLPRLPATAGQCGDSQVPGGRSAGAPSWSRRQAGCGAGHDGARASADQGVLLVVTGNLPEPVQRVVKVAVTGPRWPRRIAAHAPRSGQPRHLSHRLNRLREHFVAAGLFCAI